MDELDGYFGPRSAVILGVLGSLSAMAAFFLDQPQFAAGLLLGTTAAAARSLLSRWSLGAGRNVRTEEDAQRARRLFIRRIGARYTLGLGVLLLAAPLGLYGTLGAATGVLLEVLLLMSFAFWSAMFRNG